MKSAARPVPVCWRPRCCCSAVFAALGAASAWFGWQWGELFQSKGFLALLSLLLFTAGLATWRDGGLPLPQFVYKMPLRRHAGVKLLLLRVDMTDFNAGHKQLLERHGGHALPYAVVFDRQGRPLKAYTGLFSVESLVETLTLPR